MTFSQKIIFLLRIALGWIYFYAGITKLLTPNWSAEGYLKTAQIFTSFYQWLTTPMILPVVNFLNAWGLTLLGLCLLLGIFVRVSSSLGILLMALYYLSALHFPYAGKTYLLIDEHVIFSLVLLLLATSRAGRIWGLENWCSSLPICSRFPKLRKWIG